MDWRRKFDSREKDLGLSYFEAGRVQGINIRKIGSIISASAIVRGTLPYKVNIVVTNDKLTARFCSCPAYVKLQRCKHIAALCYAYEAEETMERAMQAKAEKEAEANKVRVYPFEIPQDGAYRYYRLDLATQDMKIYDVDVKKAQAYVDRCRVREGYETENNIGTYLKCEDSERGSVVLASDKILKMLCYGRDCKDISGFTDKANRRLCPHTIAMMLSLQKFLNAEKDIDATNQSAQKLLDRFERFGGFEWHAEEDTDKPKKADVRLTPRIIYDGSNLFADLKVGCGKMYLIKSPSKLIFAEKNEQIYQLGKTSEIDFATQTFDELSRPFYDMIVGASQGMEAVRNWQREYYHSMPYNYGAGDTILLEGHAEQVFDYLDAGGTAEFINRTESNKATKLIAANRQPIMPLQLTLKENSQGEPESLRLWGKVPILVKSVGKYYGIFETGKEAVMCEMPEKTAVCIERLKDAEDSNMIDLMVGRNNMGVFCRNVLPAIRECFDLTEPEQETIEPYLPPIPVFRYYLDSKDGIPECKIDVSYGDVTYDLLKEAQTENKVRDQYREKKAVEAAGKYFSEVDKESGKMRFEAQDDDRLFKLFDQGIEDFEKYGEVYLSDAFGNTKIKPAPGMNIGVSVSKSGELLNLNIETQDMSLEELAELLEKYDIRKKYYRFRDGSFVRIDETVEEMAKLTEALQLRDKDIIKGNMNIPAFRALYLDSMLEQISDIRADRDSSFRNLIKNMKTINEADYEVPESLKPIMREYQVKGYRWLRTIAECGFGGVLADDMGLGKTLQTISVLLAAFEEGETRPSLVVCPASLVYNWQEEIKRFAPALTACAVAGTKKEREDIIEHAGNYNVLITSYDLLKRDIGLYEGVKFAYEIIDEAQYIKTHATAAAKAVKVIEAVHRFALTGTPIENRLSELWSIFDYVMPGFLYGYTYFRGNMETPIVKHGDQEISARLKKMVSPFILRRLKEDVLKDLPEKMEEIRYAKMEPEQRHVYDAQALKLTNTIRDTDEEAIRKDTIMILRELTRIRQICCDPSLLFENYEGGSAKRQLCMDMIESAIGSGHRMLLFSQFTSMLSLLERDLQERNIEYYKITGETNKAERLELVKKFNQNTVPVFLISLKAGGTGLNLTGADMVIHYDPWWNIAAQNQATDRAHRIGQTKKVTVYRLIAKDTIEERIMQLQDTKRALADEILSGENISISNMSKKDLLELFA